MIQYKNSGRTYTLLDDGGGILTEAGAIANGYEKKEESDIFVKSGDKLISLAVAEKLKLEYSTIVIKPKDYNYYKNYHYTYEDNSCICTKVGSWKFGYTTIDDNFKFVLRLKNNNGTKLILRGIEFAVPSGVFTRGNIISNTYSDSKIITDYENLTVEFEKVQGTWNTAQAETLNLDNMFYDMDDTNKYISIEGNNELWIDITFTLKNVGTVESFMYATNAEGVTGGGGDPQALSVRYYYDGKNVGTTEILAAHVWAENLQSTKADTPMTNRLSCVNIQYSGDPSTMNGQTFAVSKGIKKIEADYTEYGDKCINANITINNEPYAYVNGAWTKNAVMPVSELNKLEFKDFKKKFTAGSNIAVNFIFTRKDTTQANNPRANAVIRQVIIEYVGG